MRAWDGDLMDVLATIRNLLGADRVVVDKAGLAFARCDQSTNVDASWPYALVRVKSVDELVAVARICLSHKMPIVMRGAGTGKSGGAVADEHSIIIDASALNSIIAIDKENLVAEVEPGVILADLQDAVMAAGLYYPPDPASRAICTIGGNVAENAAGPSTLKYGATRDYLLGGRALLGTGELIDFGKRCPKGVAGYDIAALLCGSEGSLAIFTKLILRLLPLPKSQAASMVYFADERASLRAVNAILLQGHLPKALEYIDSHCLQALAALLNFTPPKGATSALIIECDASYESGAKRQLDAIITMLKEYSMLYAEGADTDACRRALWDKRSRLSDACTRFRGHKLSEDVAVPLGAIADFGDAVKLKAVDPNLTVGLFGHAGDGNLHVQIMFADAAHKPQAEQLRHEILLLVLKHRGTITAEHGVGLQKKAYLPLEQSHALIDLQKRIKAAFDPHYLLNPGKIFDRF